VGVGAELTGLQKRMVDSFVLNCFFLFLSPESRRGAQKSCIPKDVEEVSCICLFLLEKGFLVFRTLSNLKDLSKRFTLVIWRKEKEEGTKLMEQLSQSIPRTFCFAQIMYSRVFSSLTLFFLSLDLSQ
jgi:hypothetical protein